MKKKFLTKIKLLLPAGCAIPTPIMGSKLSSLDINLLDFCKKYNKKTMDQKGLIIPVSIKIFKDNSYDIIIKTPSTTSLIKKFLVTNKDSANINTYSSNKLIQENINKIIEKKKLDFKTLNFFQIKQMILGTALSMGIKY